MKLFISWSGEHSHHVALVLRDWLPSVLQHIDPWVSSEDIDKGAVWLAHLGGALKDAGFGIVCLVPSNLHAPWIVFEAGAMSREIDTARVSPLLVGVDRSNVKGPLALFQSTVVDQEDVRRLVRSINKASATPVPDDRLNRTYDGCWPVLARQLESLVQTADVASRSVAVVAPTQESLPEKQVEFLTYLGNNPHLSPTIRTIAQKITESETRAQYHADQLRRAGFIRRAYDRNGERVYSLLEPGRAYVVERDLV